MIYFAIINYKATLQLILLSISCMLAIMFDKVSLLTISNNN